MINLTVVDVKVVSPNKVNELTINLEETKRFYFESDDEGLIFCKYAKQTGAEIIFYQGVNTVSVNSAKSELNLMIERTKNF